MKPFIIQFYRPAEPGQYIAFNLQHCAIRKEVEDLSATIGFPMMWRVTNSWKNVAGGAVLNEHALSFLAGSIDHIAEYHNQGVENGQAIQAGSR